MLPLRLQGAVVIAGSVVMVASYAYCWWIKGVRRERRMKVVMLFEQ